MKKLNYCLLLPAILLCYVQLYSQENMPDSSGINFKKVFNKIALVADHINIKLCKQSARILSKMENQEAKLYRKLIRKDTAAANKLFGNAKKKYETLRSGIAAVSKDVPFATGAYNINLDTIEAGLQFLQQKIDFPDQGFESQNALNALRKINSVDLQMFQAESVRQFLKERRQYIKEQLPGLGLLRKMGKMNKTIFYYSQAINQYKEILRDSRASKAMAMAIIRRIPAFKRFIDQHSRYSGLFGMETRKDTLNLSSSDLQSRSSVQQYIQAFVPTSGSNAEQFLSHQLQTSSQQNSAQLNIPGIEELADNLGDIPDFKPNRQRGKSLGQRLEYGTNVQFGRINRILPVTGEMAIFLGYKLNNDGVIGIGSSYKLGLGSRISNIRFSHQGFGIRSYVDWKITKSLYLSGGYEKNYLASLNETIGTSIPVSNWQESGLIGLSKKYSMGRKRKGTIQLLFDFLSYRNAPQSRALLIRTGINF